MTQARTLLLIGLWISLGACASSKEAILPDDGPTMATIYTRHFTDVGLTEPDSVRASVQVRPIQDNERDLEGYTRDAFNELDLHFPRLPNPTLVLYVYPHLAGPSRVPVPGYATTFPLYERVEYALPGEVASEPRPANRPKKP